MDEIERTYLARYLPNNLASCLVEQIIDIYLPKDSEHPKLRIRKNGGRYEITKKEPLEESDASHQEEQTIKLTVEEFESLNSLDGKKIIKSRYRYPYGNFVAEIDIFNADLEGLVLIDFEFPDLTSRDSFKTPDFCLVEVTQEEFIAGGKLCGKTYRDIEKKLKQFNYKKLIPQ